MPPRMARWGRQILQPLLQPLLTPLEHQLDDQRRQLQALQADLLALTFTVATSRSSESGQGVTMTRLTSDPHLGRQ